MHSRIFELSDEQLDCDEYLTSDNSVFNYFTESIADYVSDDVIRDKNIRCLLSRLSFDETNDKFGADAETTTFYSGFIGAYFAKRIAYIH